MGDVVTALGRAVQEEGHRVEVILPKYDCIQYDEVGHVTQHTKLSPVCFWVRYACSSTTSLVMVLFDASSTHFDPVWAGLLASQALCLCFHGFVVTLM